MENGLTEEEMLRVIASQIARNQCSYDSKTEEEKKDLFPKVEMVADSQMAELKKNFNSVLSSAGVEVVPKMKLELLEKIRDRVKDEKISSFSNIFTSEEMINYISREATVIDERLQKLKRIDGDIPRSGITDETFVTTSIFTQFEMEDKKAEFCETGKTTMPNGLEIYYTDPDDERFRCTKEQAAEDVAIEFHQYDLRVVFDAFEKEPHKYDESMQLLDTIVEFDNGRDAALRFIESQFDENGIEFLTQNHLGKGFFEMLSTKLKRDRETGTGMKDDNYTIFTKMKLFSRIKEEYKKGNITDKDFEAFEKQMKDMDPELYEMIQKNPALLEKIQKDNFETKDVNTNDSNNLAIKFVGNSDAITREETFERLNEYIRNNPECQNEPTGEELKPVGEMKVIEPEKKIERSYNPPKTTPKTPRDILENNKRLMIRCYNQRGIETVLKALSKNSTAEQLDLKMRTAWLEAVTELFDPEKLGTEESIIRTEDDWIAVKEHLKSVCEDEKAYKYVQKLGAAVKTISDSERGKKVLEVESVEEIVERFAEGTDKFNGEQGHHVDEGR